MPRRKASSQIKWSGWRRLLSQTPANFGREAGPTASHPSGIQTAGHIPPRAHKNEHAGSEGFSAVLIFCTATTSRLGIFFWTSSVWNLNVKYWQKHNTLNNALATVLSRDFKRRCSSSKKTDAKRRRRSALLVFLFISYLPDIKICYARKVWDIEIISFSPANRARV